MLLLLCFQYLDFDNLPDTNFSCDGKVIGGYYADVETGCQMFHVCTIGQKGKRREKNKNKTQPNSVFRFAETTFFRHASRSVAELYNRSNPVIVIYIKKKKKNGTRIQSALLQLRLQYYSLCYSFARMIKIIYIYYICVLHAPIHVTWVYLNMIYTYIYHRTLWGNIIL